MPAIDDKLRTWRTAGLIDAATEQRILAHERTHAAAPAGDRPTLLEGLIYVGLAIVAVGVLVLVASNWDSFPAPLKLAIPGLPAVAGLAAGAILRRSPLASMRRGAAVTWLVAAALLTRTAIAFAAESDWRGEDALLLAALVATAAAIALWLLNPTNPQLAGLAAGFVLLCAWLAVNASNHHLATGSIAVALVGVGAIGLTEAGILRPLPFARVIGAAFTAGGVFLASFDGGGAPWAETSVFVAAFALIALSVQRGGFVYMLAGVAALFLGLTASIARHVDDPTLAALAFIVVGVAVIAVVMLLVRRRPWAEPAI